MLKQIHTTIKTLYKKFKKPVHKLPDDIVKYLGPLYGTVRFHKPLTTTPESSAILKDLIKGLCECRVNEEGNSKIVFTLEQRLSSSTQYVIHTNLYNREDTTLFENCYVQVPTTKDNEYICRRKLEKICKLDKNSDLLYVLFEKFAFELR
jgi:hypothetical protein